MSTLTERFDSLAQAVGVANHNVRVATDAQRGVEADIARITDAIQGFGSRPVARRKRSRRRSSGQSWNRTIYATRPTGGRGARRAAQAAEVERDTFAIEHADELLRERREVHREVLTSIEDVKGALVDLTARLRDEEALTQTIQRHAQRQSDRLPGLDAATGELARQLKRQPRPTQRVAA